MKNLVEAIKNFEKRSMKQLVCIFIIFPNTAAKHKKGSCLKKRVTKRGMIYVSLDRERGGVKPGKKNNMPFLLKYDSFMKT
jgi:hypothetical protein